MTEHLHDPSCAFGNPTCPAYGETPPPRPSLRHRFLDALLGPRCPSCGERVFPRDLPAHRHIEHAGDPTPNPERTPAP